MCASDEARQPAQAFADIAEPSRYQPLPDDWMLGLADVVQSTQAIRENRYKAVNMAVAAVIAAVANALGNRDFPFVFGGDGASFAVPPADIAAARTALAQTATWVREELNLALRVALIPVSEVHRHGFAVNVNNDLDPFSWVVACGLPEVTMTSLAAEGISEGLKCFRKRAAWRFCEAFGRRQRLVSAARRAGWTI